jgi:hypothetical protein
MIVGHTRFSGFVLILITGLLSFPVMGDAGGEGEQLRRANRALRGWLELIEGDRLHLVVDRQAGQVRLQHGEAALRNCPVLVDSLGEWAEVRGELRQRIRRYRPSDPWVSRAAGPFDWEQNLAEEATDECGLCFSNGLLIYASAVWGGPRAPSLKIGSDDLRALYEACRPGTPLVVLPRGWKEGSADE